METMNKPKTGRLYYLLNCLIVLALAFPCITSPPRGDWWAAFSHFYKFKGFGSEGLRQLMDFNTFAQGRFQPSHIFLYGIYNLFGSNFMLYNILTLLLYFVLLYLIYRLCSYFIKSALLIFLIISFFSVLSTHFDIIRWSYHCYIILGAIALFFALNIICSLVDQGKAVLFLPVSLIMLVGLFCYEPYFLWPVMFLPLTIAIKNNEGYKKQSNKPVFLVCFSVFLAYLFYILLMSNWMSSSYTELQYGALAKMIHPAMLLKTFCYSFNNLFFINFLAGLVPFLVFPLKISANVELGGFLFNVFFLSRMFKAALFILPVALLIAFFTYLARPRINKIFTASFLLMGLGSFFILCLARMQTNDIFYVLSQPRYQFIPNLCLSMALLFLLDGIYRNAGKIVKGVLVFLLSSMLLLNIFFSWSASLEISKILAAPALMLGNINKAIKNKMVTERSRLYISPELVGDMPELCWNSQMFKIIKQGTMEYAFKGHLDHFSFTKDKARYIIDRETYEVVSIR